MKNDKLIIAIWWYAMYALNLLSFILNIKFEYYAFAFVDFVLLILLMVLADRLTRK